ncbi:MAG: PQQ-binding-like beta-propeller repeat protein [Candidatus Helarchaeota archaeon]|nr:PQQ-binding-like beta-propeller repeat protein [Candidatus Helarchaeota archaeon]
MKYRALSTPIGFIFIFVLLFVYIGCNTNVSSLDARSNASDSLQLATVPGSSDPTQDEWPMFRGQLNHTGEAHTTPTIHASPFWTYSTDFYVRSSPAVVSGRVYIGSIDDKVYCLNATTGGYLWSYTTGGNVGSSPAVADGRVYIGGQDYKIYCLDAITGGYIWSYTTGDSVESSPAVAGGRVYISSDDYKVYCLNATTGAHLWNYTTGFYVKSSPAAAGGRVYVGCSDNKVYCLNATTGAHLWNFTTGGAVDSSPAVADGRVCIGSYYGRVYCLNATTGGSIWSYDTGGGIFSSPAVAGGRVYLGCLDDKVYCLNATTGAYLWNFTTGDYVESSPAVADGRVYIGSCDTKVYCLNATTGGLLWNYTTENLVRSSPAVAGGRVYVGSDDYRVYCLPTDAALPTYTMLTEYTDPLELGSAETITIFGVAALSGIQTVLLEFDGTNYSMTNLGDGTWRYAWIPGSTGDYPYTIYLQDTMGNWNATSRAIQVVSPTPPTYTSVTESANPLELGATETITIAGLTDLSGIQTVLLAFGGYNHTMTNLTNSTWYYNTWTPNSTGTYPYTIFIQDKLGLWNATSGALQVVDTNSIPAFTLPLVIIAPFLIAGVFIWKKRTKL